MAAWPHAFGGLIFPREPQAILLQVFGHTGTRTLKELLAEAETPTKRGLSARTGGPSAADDPFGGPPTPNGAAGDVHSGESQGIYQTLPAFTSATCPFMLGTCT